MSERQSGYGGRMGDVKRHDTFMDEHDKKSKAVKESRSDRDASNRQRVAKLRPIDDCLFEKLAEDRGVCEEMLRVILEETDLKVLHVTPQNSVKNLYGRSVRLERVYTFFSAAAFFRAQKRIAKAIRFDQTALIHKEFVKVS